MSESTVGATLIALGMALRGWSLRTLIHAGISAQAWSMPEQPAQIVCDGPYRWLRHPAYLGSLGVIAGVGVLALGWGGATLALAAWPFYAGRMALENQWL